MCLCDPLLHCSAPAVAALERWAGVWPDHGVPDNVMSLISFIRHILKFRNALSCAVSSTQENILSQSSLTRVNVVESVVWFIVRENGNSRGWLGKFGQGLKKAVGTSNTLP